MGKRFHKYLSCFLALITVFSLGQPMAALAAETDSGTIAPKIWLTEIYPNDIARNASYTGLSGATIDSMDYIEVYNASDSEMDFGADYNLVYTDSGDKILTYNEAELKIPAKTPAVFWIRRVDLEGRGRPCRTRRLSVQAWGSRTACRSFRSTTRRP
ncbi:hypothetical protein N6H14_10065 [Paenibacillus sp. CC-CFT747]|nr:hypothetical protein N6H14_10065 [Paenibacillus sp. CC-CFT747]